MESVNSLTVKELIELLQEFSDEQSGNEELPVVFAYNYGDHWHTEVLGEVNQVQEEVAEWSSYHEMFKLSDDAEIPVCVLS